LRRPRPPKDAPRGKKVAKSRRIRRLEKKQNGAGGRDVQHKDGATLPRSWKPPTQAHGVRGFISRTLGKKFDLPVVPEKPEDG